MLDCAVFCCVLLCFAVLHFFARLFKNSSPIFLSNTQRKKQESQGLTDILWVPRANQVWSLSDNSFLNSQEWFQFTEKHKPKPSCACQGCWQWHFQHGMYTGIQGDVRWLLCRKKSLIDWSRGSIRKMFTLDWSPGLQLFQGLYPTSPSMLASKAIILVLWLVATYVHKPEPWPTWQTVWHCLSCTDVHKSEGW